ncbi:MAG: antibiotic biosynthesis monooxygenase [Chloroflexi bacterium]|nr:antibiotic biosynthesis monooxygenase [Chloroflexota bacterium]
MFVAMNRFQISEGQEEEFERSWRERDSYLDEVPGFQKFALLKGDQAGEYISHSTWESRDAFEAWTQSDVFRKAHGQPLARGVMQDAPHVSLYEAILTTPEEAD